MTFQDLIADLRAMADHIEYLTTTGNCSPDQPMGEHKRWNWKRRIVVTVAPATPANENEAAEYLGESPVVLSGEICQTCGQRRGVCVCSTPKFPGPYVCEATS